MSREPKNSTGQLSRIQVLDIINKERDYQESQWDLNELLPSGLTRAQRNLETTPFLVMIKSYLDEAIYNWTWDYKRGTDEVTVLQGLVKIAALAAAALEYS